jgi:Type II secretion system (T2SS), protein E, N-terminal domain
MSRKLGELLVAEGRISEAVLARALELQGTQSRGLRLGAILLRWGLVSEKALLDSLGRVHKCPAVSWDTLSKATQDALNLLSAAQSKRLAAVPYALDKKTVQVAFANPSDLAAVDEVGSITRCRVIVHVTSEVRLLQAQQRFYQRPLPRDVWTILQKIEHPAAARKAPARAAASKLTPRPITLPAALQGAAPLAGALPEKAAPPPELVPPSLWIEATEESARAAETCQYPAGESGEDTVRVDSSVEDLFEPAPAIPPLESLTVAVESGDEQNVPVLHVASAEIAANFEHLALEELLGERLDPFADETPLTEFIEQALAFYEAQPAFQSALNALDVGPVEDLEIEVEEEPPTPPAPEAPSMATSEAPSMASSSDSKPEVPSVASGFDSKPEAPSMASGFDSTHPSLRRGQRSEARPN